MYLGEVSVKLSEFSWLRI